GLKGNKPQDELFYEQRDNLTPPMSFGYALLDFTPQSDDVAAAVIARSKLLNAKNPALAQALLDFVAGWAVPSAEALLLERLAGGNASSEDIHNLVWNSRIA